MQSGISTVVEQNGKLSAYRKLFLGCELVPEEFEEVVVRVDPTGPAGHFFADRYAIVLGIPQVVIPLGLRDPP